jgi:hypothetical protein
MISLTRYKIGQTGSVTNMRQREGKRLGEERRARAHRRRWNQTEMLAEMSDSDEESFRAGDVSGGEEKRGE